MQRHEQDDVFSRHVLASWTADPDGFFRFWHPLLGTICSSSEPRTLAQVIKVAQWYRRGAATPVEECRVVSPRH